MWKERRTLLVISHAQLSPHIPLSRSAGGPAGAGPSQLCTPGSQGCVCVMIPTRVGKFGFLPSSTTGWEQGASFVSPPSLFTGVPILLLDVIVCVCVCVLQLWSHKAVFITAFHHSLLSFPQFFLRIHGGMMETEGKSGERFWYSVSTCSKGNTPTASAFCGPSVKTLAVCSTTQNAVS